MLRELFASLTGSAKFKSTSPREASPLITSKKVFLLDVRSPQEFKSSHIAGAVNIPLDQLQSRLSELSSYKEKAVIVNCLSGGRSSSACGVLTSAGFSDITNLSGGISGWMQAGLPVVR